MNRGDFIVVGAWEVNDNFSKINGLAKLLSAEKLYAYKQALLMKQLSEKYGIKIMVNYETTWYASNHHAYKLVNSGSFDEIRRINVYDGRQGPKEIGCSDMFLSWLTNPVKNGGGAVIDFGCYGANLATWFMHGAKPISVYAVLQHNKPEVYPNVDDDATIVLEYPDTTVQIMAS